MVAYLIHEVSDPDTMTLTLSPAAKQLVRGHRKVEVQIRPFDERTGAKHHRFYRGVFIPNIIHQFKELNGVTLSEGEVDLINKKEANNGKWKMVITKNGEELIQFHELQISKMSVQEFNEFIHRCNMHWSEKGIEPPDENTR